MVLIRVLTWSHYPNLTDLSSPPDTPSRTGSLNYIEDDELLEEEASVNIAQENESEFDPDFFLWKKASLTINEPDFSSGN